MKNYPIALMLFILCARLDAEDIKLLSIGWTAASQGKGHADFHVPREELEKVPEWKPEDRKPAPLTRNQAVEIVRHAAVAQGLTLTDETRFTVTLQKMNPAYVRLLNDRPVNGCLWFYTVCYLTHEVSGRDWFVVSMSGAVATRTISTGGGA